HCAVTSESLAERIAGVALSGVTPIVRVPSNDSALIQRVLDLGGAGVVIPNVSTPEEAAHAVSACRYPPRGARSFGQVRGGFGTIANANQETLCIAMIETEEGLHNVDAIAGTAGLDAIYLGPADLSLSLGVEFDPGFTDPAIVDAMEKIMMACDKNGIVAGR